MLGHVHVDNFPRGEVPRQILFWEKPGPARAATEQGAEVLCTDKLGASPEAR